MGKVLAISGMNKDTMTIINTIRANASSQYQEQVPEVTDLQSQRKVGDVLYGYPAFANEFMTSLMNRIALVVIKSAFHENRFKALKKGEISLGETIEEVFVEMAKAREFNIEQSPRREMMRTLPDVRAAFHVMNWRVQYPITVDGEQLHKAFLADDGVTSMLERIISSVYTGNEYDEELLTKYLIIKGVVNGKMHPVPITDKDDAVEAGKAFRSLSNRMEMLSNTYNAEGVRTKTLKEDQYIFMDADYEAAYGFDILLKAYNISQGELSQKVFLVDDWTTFDNERFSEIRRNSDQIEEVTTDELNLMKGVVAVVVDEEWFQIYDNLTKLTETYVASGDYHNYFLNIERTVSTSPFSNAAVVVDASAPVIMPETLTATVTAKDKDELGTVIGVEIEAPNVLGSAKVKFLNTQDSVEKGIAVQPYGLITFPEGQTSITLEVEVGDVEYIASAVTTVDDAVGTQITFNKK